MFSFKLVRAILCTFVVMIGLLEFLYENIDKLVAFGGGIVALFAIIVLFPLTAIYTRVIVLILCASGMVLFFRSETLSWQIFEGFMEMAPMVALLSSITFLGVAVELGNFTDLFQRFYSNAKRLYRSYFFSLIISYILSFFSLSGAIAPLYHLIIKNLNKTGFTKGTRFVITSVIRGYAMAIISTPVSATVGIALKYSGLSWAQIAAPVFLLSFIGLLLAFFLETNWIGKNMKFFDLKTAQESELNLIEESIQSKKSGVTGSLFKKKLSFLLFFIGVIGCIFFLGNVLHFSSLNSISLGCLIATFIWGALSGYFKQLLSHSRSFFSNGIIHLSDQISLLIAAGFFTFSMEHNGGLEWLGYFVQAASEKIGVTAVLSIVPVLILSLSFISVHPFASGIIIASAISASSLDFEQLGFAVAIVSGITLGVLISPFSAVILILSSFSGESPYRLGFRWNISFVVAFLVLTAIAIMLIMK